MLQRGAEDFRGCQIFRVKKGGRKSFNVSRGMSIFLRFCLASVIVFIKVKRIFTVASVKDCKQRWHLSLYYLFEVLFFHEVSLHVVTFFDEVFKSI